MAIRVYKRTTAGRRNSSVNLHAEVTRSKPEKSLLRALPKTGGRNCQGKLTVIQQGGGHKRRYRMIDFKRRKDDVVGTIQAVEYDPNRSCHIALVEYADGEKRYIICPKGLTKGSKVVSSRNAVEPDVGNCMPIKHIPTGLDVHCVELEPGKARPCAVPPAWAPGSPTRKAAWPPSCCRAARSARSSSTAAPPSAWSATRTTPTSSSARPAATAGSAAVPAPVASP